ncbi:MAG: glycosyltransferase involved in cell wall biosynthesis, partial [Paraglaciecola sp.]
RSIVQVLKFTLGMAKGQSKTNSVFHFHDPENLFVAYFLSIRGYNVIWDSHEDFPRQLSTKYWVPNKLSKIIEFLSEKIEDFIASRLSGIVAATPLIENRFKLVNHSVVCVKNYPVLDEFIGVPEKKVPNKKLCYIGSITRERGIIEILEVLKTLGPEYTLILCGVYDSELLKIEVENHPSYSQVDFRGYLDRKGIAEALSDSDAGLVTLHPNPNQIEALPIKLFEYMAAGLPVIASDFPLWRGIVEASGCGYLVNPLSVADIANAVVSLTSDQIKYKACSINGRQAAVEHYSWQGEGEKLIEFYKNIFELTK